MLWVCQHNQTTLFQETSVRSFCKRLTQPLFWGTPSLPHSPILCHWWSRFSFHQENGSQQENCLSACFHVCRLHCLSSWYFRQVAAVRGQPLPTASGTIQACRLWNVLSHITSFLILSQCRVLHVLPCLPRALVRVSTSTSHSVTFQQNSRKSVGTISGFCFLSPSLYEF